MAPSSLPRLAGARAPRLDPAQVRALVAPARQEIVDALEAAGPRSVAELGALLGRPADALYHHLKRLVRVGLLKVEARKQGRHVFSVYDLALRPLRLSYAAPVRSADVARVVAAAQRTTLREFRRALASGTAVVEGPRRDLRGGRAKGWLTPGELERVNALLEELMTLVSGGRPGPGATPISVSFVLAPSPANARAAPATATRSTERKPRR